MILQALFPRDIVAELERLQRDVQQNIEVHPNIRGRARGNFPALNVGGSGQSVDLYAFAPGLDPADIEVQIENGVLTIAGERPREQRPVQATVPIDERFAGRCRRVVNLPDDIAAHHAEVALPRYRRVFTLSKELDTALISAEFRHGVLSSRIPKAPHAQPRRIEVQLY